jgi:hypothetical protein
MEGVLCRIIMPEMGAFPKYLPPTPGSSRAGTYIVVIFSFPPPFICTMNTAKNTHLKKNPKK